MGLTGRVVFGVAMIAAFVFLAAAQRPSPSSTPSPAKPPASSPVTLPGTSPSTSPCPVTRPRLRRPRRTRISRRKRRMACTASPSHSTTISADAGVPPPSPTASSNLSPSIFPAERKMPRFYFPIPLPANPVNLVHGITKTGPPIDFESGQHLISVSAHGARRHAVERSVCTTWITIP